MKDISKFRMRHLSKGDLTMCGILIITSYHHTRNRVIMYQAIQSERLYEQIVQQIEKRFLSGDLKVGDRLPPERELAEQFGVSRTAVREAGKALRQRGLVEIQPGRGTFITNGASEAVRHSLGLLMKIAGTDASPDLIEVREIIEPEIAARSAMR